MRIEFVLKTSTKILFALLFSLLTVMPASAETRIASWNLKRLSATNKDFASVSKIISYFDLIAIQEVMSEEALFRLVEEVQATTGTEWGVMPSHAIGRGSYKEIYAFLWRKSHVSFVDSAIVYLDNADVFAREPLSARFQTKDGANFIMANIHVLYGDSKSDRVPEIKALREYWQWLGETFPGEQFFLAGDFNMPPEDASFRDLKRFAIPTVTTGATTLSMKPGQYANLYDNIWVPNNLTADMSAGIFDFPKVLGMEHKEARSRVSDHAPVYVVLKTMDEATGHFDKKLAQPPAAAPAIAKVRANKSSKIFHLPGCPNYVDMKRSKNLIEFNTETEAVKSGFRKANNCGPAG